MGCSCTRRAYIRRRRSCQLGIVAPSLNSRSRQDVEVAGLEALADVRTGMKLMSGGPRYVQRASHLSTFRNCALSRLISLISSSPTP